MKFIRYSCIIITLLFITISCRNNSEDNQELIVLKAFNGKYVGLAGGTIGLKLIATKTKITELEKFTMIHLDSNNVNFKIFDHLFVCVDYSLPGEFLVADRLVASTWETFTIEDIGRNQIAIKASNGKYVSANLNKKFLLIPDSDQIGDWEKFTIIKQK